MFWDDQDNILFNTYVHDWQYFSRYFTENNVAGRGLVSNYWRPLPLTIWSVEWHLWQGWAPGYHFVQIALHVSAAYLLFLLLLRLFEKRWIAFFTSLLFLAHPLQTEAITYVSGISDPLSANLLFAGLLLYIRWRSANKLLSYSPIYILLLGTYLLSLMARETAVFFIGYFVLVEFVLHAKTHKTILWKRLIFDSVFSLWPFVFLALGYVALRAGPLNFENTFNLYNEQNQFTQSVTIRILTFFRIITHYLQLLFWPFDLHMERSVELAANLQHLDVLLGGFVLIVSFAAALFFLKKSPVVTFSIGWIMLGLFPTSNILVPINGLMFEHWLYIPMIGFWFLLLWIATKAPHKTKPFSLILFFVFLIFLLVRTIKQNALWRDPIRFYNYTLTYAPKSYRVLNNLGMAYADANDHVQAVQTYERAIHINPTVSVGYHNLGNSLLNQGKKEEAIQSFEKAISLQPNFLFSYKALAQLYLTDKDYTNARLILERSLDNIQNPTQTLFTLAQIAYEEKDITRAIGYLEKARRFDPTNQTVISALYQLRSIKP